jgi:hypothetical protein
MNYIPDEFHPHSKQIARRMKLRERMANFFEARRTNTNSSNLPTITQLSQEDSSPIQTQMDSMSPEVLDYPLVSFASKASTVSETTVSTLHLSSPDPLFGTASDGSESSSSHGTQRTSVVSKKKKVPSKTTTNTSDWLGRLPKCIEMTPMRKSAIKSACRVVPGSTSKSNMSKKMQVKVGSLVHKKLKILARDSKRSSKSRWQKAIVFGTVKERVKRGRWLVKFENDQQMTLKADEFFLICEDQNQQVISFNDSNEIMLKDPKINLIDLTCEKAKLVDLTGDNNTVDLTSSSTDVDDKLKTPYTK